MQPILNIAIKAARKGADIITRSLDKIDTLNITKKGRNDFVSEVDQRAEQEIITIIRRAYPSHGILAEESGADSGDEFVWIIDPLDGTTNFLHGFPQFAVSIGVQQNGRMVHGVIYDPIRHELFTASRGEGAQLNERRIRISKASHLDGSLLGTGFPFRELDYLDDYIEMFKQFVPLAAGIRRAGSASLDLAYVAAGRLDGFWEYGLKPWDMAAGIVLIREAGGMLSDFQGGDDYFTSGNIIVGNTKILRAMLQIIHRHA